MYRVVIVLMIFFVVSNASIEELYKRGEYKEIIKRFKNNNLISKAYLAKVYFKLGNFKESKKIILNLLKNKRVPLQVKKELNSYLLYINFIEKPLIYYNIFVNSQLDIYKNSYFAHSKLYLSTWVGGYFRFIKNNFIINGNIQFKNFKNLSQKIIDSKQDYNQFNIFLKPSYKYFGLILKYQYLDFYNTSMKDNLYVIGGYAQYKINNFGVKIGPVYEKCDIYNFKKLEGLIGININFKVFKFVIDNYIANNFYKLVIKNLINLDKDKIFINYEFYNLIDKGKTLSNFKLNYLHQIHKYFGVNYEIDRKSYGKILDYYVGFGVYFNFKGKK